MVDQDLSLRPQPQRGRFFPAEGGKPRIIEDLHSFNLSALTEYSCSLIPDLRDITLHESEKHPLSGVVTGKFPTEQGDLILPLGVVTTEGQAYTTLYPLYEGEFELLEDEQETDPSGDFPTPVFEVSLKESMIERSFVGYAPEPEDGKDASPK